MNIRLYATQVSLYAYSLVREYEAAVAHLGSIIEAWDAVV